MTRHFYLLLLLLVAQAAHADGGRLTLHQQAGPFVVTLFTSPDPLTEGYADFSVAVERAGNQGLVQDANVTLILTPADGGSEPVVLQASHEAATSRFLQAADVSLPRRGIWTVTVIAEQGADKGRCSGQIDVLPSRLATDATTWAIAAVPILIALFAVHQMRKRSRRGVISALR